MGDTRMLTVIAYDIARDRTRAKVADLLEARLARVQESVFEGRLTESESLRLFRTLEALLDEGDRLRLYAIARAGLPRCRASGGAPLPEDGSFYLL